MAEHDLDRQLTRNGERWRATRPAGPELDDALKRLKESPRPRRRWLAPLASAAVVLVIVGASLAYHFQSGPHQVVTSVGAHLASCGTAPVSSGALSSGLTLTVTAPAAARSGTRVQVSSRISARRNTVTGMDAGAPADVLIVDQGQIVGRYRGAIAGVGFGGPITKKGKPVPTLPILLSGCPSGTVNATHPDASRRALPPGIYQLLVTLRSEGPHHRFQLVSAPTTIRVTR